MTRNADLNMTKRKTATTRMGSMMTATSWSLVYTVTIWVIAATEASQMTSSRWTFRRNNSITTLTPNHACALSPPRHKIFPKPRHSPMLHSGSSLVFSPSWFKVTANKCCIKIQTRLRLETFTTQIMFCPLALPADVAPKLAPEDRNWH